MKSNIWKYYLFSLFRQFFFFAPVLVLFFQENHLSMTQILLLQSIYSIAIVILEIPTGTIGDYFGKKVSVSIGALLFALGLGIYSFGTNFFIFLIAELTCGFGSSLISGSDSALIHSTLKTIKKEKDYKKVEGTANSLKLTGFMFGGLLGGWIAHYSLRMTMVGSAGIAFLTFLISLLIVEPRLKVKEEEKESFKEIMINSIQIVKNHKLILWLFFYSSIITALAHIMIWYYQPYFVLVNIPVIHFGWIYAVMGIVAIIASKYTQQIEEFFGNKGSLIFLSALIVISSFFLGKIIALFAVGFFLLHQVFSGIAKTIFNDRILQIVPSTKSATILSINNLGIRFIYALAGPFFGYLTDTYDLQTTMLSLSIITLSVTILLFMIYRFIPEHFHNNKSQAP
jgi:MFS family permease